MSDDEGEHGWGEADIDDPELAYDRAMQQQALQFDDMDDESLEGYARHVIREAGLVQQAASRVRGNRFHGQAADLNRMTFELADNLMRWQRARTPRGREGLGRLLWDNTIDLDEQVKMVRSEMSAPRGFVVHHGYESE